MAVLLPRAKSGSAFNRVAPKVPIAANNNTISVPSAALNLSAKTPTVTATANNYIAVPAASLQLAAYAPAVSTGANNAISVPLATLQINGKTPTVTATANNYIAVPSASLGLTVYTPTVLVTGNNTISAPKGSLSLVAYAPTVSNGQTAVEQGGGNSTSRRRRNGPRVKTYAEYVQEYADLRNLQSKAEIKLDALSKSVAAKTELDARVAEVLRQDYAAEVDRELQEVNQLIDSVRSGMLAVMADEQESDELLLLLVMM